MAKTATRNTPATQSRPEQSESVGPKRGRPSSGVKKVAYPGARPLTIVPKDWNHETHKPLRKKDFGGNKSLFDKYMEKYGEHLAVKIDYPLEIDGEGNKILLTEWPDDFNRKAHKPLKADMFDDESIFLEGKADLLEKTVKALRRKAATLRAVGGKANQQNAKKLIKLQDKIRQLQDAIAAQGGDPEAIAALLASTNGEAQDDDSEE